MGFVPLEIREINREAQFPCELNIIVGPDSCSECASVIVYDTRNSGDRYFRVCDNHIGNAAAELWKDYGNE